MEELAEKFDELREEQPLMGEWLVFSEVIQEEELSPEEVRELYNVVHPAGCDQRDENALLRNANRPTKKQE